MKKLNLLLVVLFGSVTLLQAQSGGNVEFTLGAGLNMSNVGSYYSNSDYSTSYNFQAGVDVYINSYWSIKAKAIYDKKGWDNDVIDIESTESGVRSGRYITDFDLDYITVPLMVNFHFGRTNNWYVNFGPYVGFLMDARDTTFDFDLEEDFNDTDAGLAFGIGVKIPVSDYMKFFIEYDGQSGFSDIFERNNRPDVTNYRGAINIGVNFML